jgi:predicted DNA-binding ribbon-helix-helix protein
MKSPVIKRSIVVSGHKTSVSLEDEFWKELREIARSRAETLYDFVGAIDVERQHSNLSSALRLFVLDFYRSQIDNLSRSPAERGGSPMRGGVRWRISARERALLAMAAAIIGALQKMDGAIAPRDRRTAFRFVRTLARIGPQSRFAEERTRAAWQKMPAYVQRQIIELPAAAGCAEELRRIVGDDAWPQNPPQLPTAFQPDESLDDK